MLAHRLRRWANINSTLGQRLMFAIMVYMGALALTIQACLPLPEV